MERCGDASRTASRTRTLPPAAVPHAPGGARHLRDPRRRAESHRAGDAGVPRRIGRVVAPAPDAGPRVVDEPVGVTQPRLLSTAATCGGARGPARTSTSRTCAPRPASTTGATRTRSSGPGPITRCGAGLPSIPRCEFRALLTSSGSSGATAVGRERDSPRCAMAARLAYAEEVHLAAALLCSRTVRHAHRIPSPCAKPAFQYAPPRCPVKSATKEPSVGSRPRSGRRFLVMRTHIDRNGS